MGEQLIALGLLKGSLDGCVETGAVSVFFPHGLGHLLGLDVHDMEDLGDAAGYDAQSRRSADPVFKYLRLSRVLESNMVVTIEPGFYQIPSLLEQAHEDDRIKDQIDWRRLEAFGDVRGIRIEDDVVVTDQGPRVLSHDAPKDLVELEEALLAS